MKTNTLKSFLTITLAMFIISVAIYFFLIPSEVITGSVTGLAMVFAKITLGPTDWTYSSCWRYFFGVNFLFRSLAIQ